MRCQVIGCDNEAEYYDTFSGHCGDSREVRVVVCRECLLGGWVFGHCEDIEKIKREIYSRAERII